MVDIVDFVENEQSRHLWPPFFAAPRAAFSQRPAAPTLPLPLFQIKRRTDLHHKRVLRRKNYDSRIDHDFAARSATVRRSRGKIRADKAHETLVLMGYEGSERTTRRTVAEAKHRWRQGHSRQTRPWIPEPGLWLQWDYGDGPEVEGRATALFCAWLAWSRFRFVLRLRDKTLASVVDGA